MKPRGPEATLKQVEFIVAKTGLLPGTDVLDACCGYGRHSIELAKLGYDVVGIDRSESYLARTGTRSKWQVSGDASGFDLSLHDSY